MKPHPKIRKTIKWGGAAVTVLLVVVWVASGWFRLVAFSGWNDTLGVSRGRVSISIPRDRTVPGFVRTKVYIRQALSFARGRWDWNFQHQQSLVGTSLNGIALRVTTESVYVPIWALLIPVAGLTLLAHILGSHRARSNLCPKCGYDRTGLSVGAVCPECGSGGTPA
jgi:hypothetical protein